MFFEQSFIRNEAVLSNILEIILVKRENLSEWGFAERLEGTEGKTCGK